MEFGKIVFSRYILFCIFFAVGASAVVLSILVSEIDDNYKGREELRKIRAENDRLEYLAEEYTLQIKEARNNPEALARLKRITLGISPQQEETAYPRSDVLDLPAAQAAIEASKDKTADPIQSPKWVIRSLESRFRQSLFIAGTGLVLITFIFFGNGANKKSQPSGKIPSR